MTTTGSLVGPFPIGADPESYDKLRRRTLWRMPTGIYVLGSRSGERWNLMTTSLVTQASVEPKLVAVSVERDALTHELVSESRCFCLALIGREDRALVRKFVKPSVHDRAERTLAGVAYLEAPSGTPYPATAAAFLDCEVRKVIALGSHTLFVGEVVDVGIGAGGEDDPILRMEDTRMSYGG